MQISRYERDEQSPFTQALIDLEDYYTVGTIPGAIIAIVEQSGAEVKKDGVRLLEVRTKEFVEKRRQEQVDKILDMREGNRKKD